MAYNIRYQLFAITSLTLLFPKNPIAEHTLTNDYVIPDSRFLHPQKQQANHHKMGPKNLEKQTNTVPQNTPSTEWPHTPSSPLTRPEIDQIDELLHELINQSPNNDQIIHTQDPPDPDDSPNGLDHSPKHLFYPYNDELYTLPPYFQFSSQSSLCPEIPNNHHHLKDQNHTSLENTPNLKNIDQMVNNQFINEIKDHISTHQSPSIFHVLSTNQDSKDTLSSPSHINASKQNKNDHIKLSNIGNLDLNDINLPTPLHSDPPSEIPLEIIEGDISSTDLQLSDDLSVTEESSVGIDSIRDLHINSNDQQNPLPQTDLSTVTTIQPLNNTAVHNRVDSSSIPIPTDNSKDHTTHNLQNISTLVLDEDDSIEIESADHEDHPTLSPTPHQSHHDNNTHHVSPLNNTTVTPPRTSPSSNLTNNLEIPQNITHSHENNLCPSNFTETTAAIIKKKENIASEDGAISDLWDGSDRIYNHSDPNTIQYQHILDSGQSLDNQPQAQFGNTIPPIYTHTEPKRCPERTVVTLEDLVPTDSIIMSSNDEEDTSSSSTDRSLSNTSNSPDSDQISQKSKNITNMVQKTFHLPQSSLYDTHPFSIKSYHPDNILSLSLTPPSTTTPPPQPHTPHLNIPITYPNFSVNLKKLAHRNNLASAETGAKIIQTSPGILKAGSILKPEKDKYALLPCTASQPHAEALKKRLASGSAPKAVYNSDTIVLQLSEMINVDTITISNFEYFSNNIMDFQVLGTAVYPTDQWVFLGHFHAYNIHEIQPFKLHNASPIANRSMSYGNHLSQTTFPIGSQHQQVSPRSATPSALFVKYLKIRVLTHYGHERYCTLTALGVYGTTMVEDFEQQFQRVNEETQEFILTQKRREDELKLRALEEEATRARAQQQAHEQIRQRQRDLRKAQMELERQRLESNHPQITADEEYDSAHPYAVVPAYNIGYYDHHLGQNVATDTKIITYPSIPMSNGRIVLINQPNESLIDSMVIHPNDRRNNTETDDIDLKALFYDLQGPLSFSTLHHRVKQLATPAENITLHTHGQNVTNASSSITSDPDDAFSTTLNTTQPSTNILNLNETSALAAVQSFPPTTLSPFLTHQNVFVQVSEKIKLLEVELSRISRLTNDIVDASKVDLHKLRQNDVILYEHFNSALQQLSHDQRIATLQYNIQRLNATLQYNTGSIFRIAQELWKNLDFIDTRTSALESAIGITESYNTHRNYNRPRKKSHKHDKYYYKNTYNGQTNTHDNHINDEDYQSNNNHVFDIVSDHQQGYNSPEFWNNNGNIWQHQLPPWQNNQDDTITPTNTHNMTHYATLTLHTDKLQSPSTDHPHFKENSSTIFDIYDLNQSKSQRDDELQGTILSRMTTIEEQLRQSNLNLAMFILFFFCVKYVVTLVRMGFRMFSIFLNIPEILFTVMGWIGTVWVVFAWLFLDNRENPFATDPNSLQNDDVSHFQSNSEVKFNNTDTVATANNASPTISPHQHPPSLTIQQPYQPNITIYPTPHYSQHPYFLVSPTAGATPIPTTTPPFYHNMGLPYILSNQIQQSHASSNSPSIIGPQNTSNGTNFTTNSTEPLPNPTSPTTLLAISPIIGQRSNIDQQNIQRSQYPHINLASPTNMTSMNFISPHLPPSSGNNGRYFSFPTVLPHLQQRASNIDQAAGHPRNPPAISLSNTSIPYSLYSLNNRVPGSNDTTPDNNQSPEKFDETQIPKNTTQTPQNINMPSSPILSNHIMHDTQQFQLPSDHYLTIPFRGTFVIVDRMYRCTISKPSDPTASVNGRPSVVFEEATFAFEALPPEIQENILFSKFVEQQQQLHYYHHTAQTPPPTTGSQYLSFPQSPTNQHPMITAIASSASPQTSTTSLPLGVIDSQNGGQVYAIHPSNNSFQYHHYNPNLSPILDHSGNTSSFSHLLSQHGINSSNSNGNRNGSGAHDQMSTTALSKVSNEILNTSHIIHDSSHGQNIPHFRGPSQVVQQTPASTQLLKISIPSPEDDECDANQILYPNIPPHLAPE